MTYKDAEKLQTATDVQMALAYLDDAGLSPRWSGLCVWCDAVPTKAKQYEALSTIEARFSPKRGKWYIRACAGLKVEL